MSEQAYDARGEAKRLLRTLRRGALATLAADGAPFASLTAVATMPDGSPILLLSRLAAHTRHLERDGRCSLLLSEGGRGDPLAHPRLTLTGTAVPAAGGTEQARRRFLARNPKSTLYADFPDFSFWQMRLAAAHLNGGFARAAQFTAPEIKTDVTGCEDLIGGEADAVAHMMADHGDAVQAYATGLASLPAGPWQMSGIDPDGLDLQLGDRTARISFPGLVRDLGSLRATLVAMATAARAGKP